MNGKSWTINAGGQPHEIEIKFGLIHCTILVDGEKQVAKSANPFVRAVDREITVGGKTVHVTALGGHAGLAIDNVYLDSGRPYVPLSSIPLWATVMIPVLMATGLFLFGVLGFAVGLIAGVSAYRMALPQEPGKSSLPLCAAIYAVTLAVQLAAGIYSHSWL